MRSLLWPGIKLIVFLIVTTVATYILAGTIANSNYGSSHGYHAIFCDVTGLQSGDDVRIAGVRVGSITGIKLFKDAVDVNNCQAQYVAKVSFTVQSSQSLPVSTIAMLRYRNLVGQRYLDLEQGTGSANDILAPGATIPITQTHPALSLTYLFNGFQPLFQGLNATQVNALSGEVIEALQGEGGSFDLLLSNLASLTNTIANKDAVIGQVVDNLASVLTAIGDRDNELSDLVVQLQRFISSLASDRTTIGNSISGINQLATQTSNLLGNIRAPLAKDITDLTGLTQNLLNNSATITSYLQALPDTIATLVRTGSYGSWFNFYLCSISADLNLPNGASVPIPVTQPSASRCQ